MELIPTPKKMAEFIGTGITFDVIPLVLGLITTDGG